MEKCSLIDYPGKIAAVVFTQGCNLNCSFCHNRQLIPLESSSPLLPVEEVLETLRERRGFLDAVVISGGEPTLQEGLVDFLAQVRSLGFATKLDTNGTRPEVIKSLLKQRLLDFIAMDLKAPLARYSEICGAKVDLAAVKASVRIIRQAGIEHQFRTTMIPQLSERDVQRMEKDSEGIDHWIGQRFRAPSGQSLDVVADKLS